MNKFEDPKMIFANATQAYENNEMHLAISLFNELAKQDIPDACQYLGLIYRTGDGVPKDPELAKFWYSQYIHLLEKQGNAGNLDAILTLGKMYQYGDQVDINEAKAFSLIKQSADSDHAEAQFHIANLFCYGWCGCNKDAAMYDYWLNRAINNNHPEAMYTKGLMLISDSGTNDEGMVLIKKSAALGFWPAQEFLTTH